MQRESNLYSFKKWLGIILYLVIIIELVIFPSLENFCGCLMALVCWLVFSNFFIKRELIVKYPFAFMTFLSIFFYRYLPLVATLIEGKPITYGFEMPYQTFFFETIMFLVASLAFHLACNNNIKSNSSLQIGLSKLGFFNSYNSSFIWGLGIVGLIARLIAFGTGTVEYGDVGGKFVSGIIYLIYAPICLLFPSLLRLKGVSTRPVFIYLTFVFILNIASNSRQAMIAPLGIYLLLFLLNALKNNIKLSSLVSPFKFVAVGVCLVFGLELISDLSLAMLATRTLRRDVSKLELFQKTIETYQDKDLMKQLKAMAAQKSGQGNPDAEIESYSTGWNESYLNNFMLNRYANMRITDQTLYYAYKYGFNQELMQNDFKIRLIALLPSPIINFFGISINKNNLEFSRADLLSRSSLGNFLVTSHVGDGLATFGYLYFPFQFLLFFIVFKLMNAYVIFTQNGVVYSLYGLMNIFFFLGMFRNANGSLVDMTFILRMFWQGIFTYSIVLFVVKKVTSFIR